ncbi:hypothetical protein PoB_005542800 [Plakobranchus ocellatus]|uniref:Uncharacterized protein n=1 Tax=Plakobranchus ocellatus TaxID=259542 RepID=A0AAV4CBR6_9GAST|nr:hypothetical protein PoB_005542800 [Plakobranchus ocellatus]
MMRPASLRDPRFKSLSGLRQYFPMLFCVEPALNRFSRISQDPAKIKLARRTKANCRRMSVENARTTRGPYTWCPDAWTTYRTHFTFTLGRPKAPFPTPTCTAAFRNETHIFRKQQKEKEN